MSSLKRQVTYPPVAGGSTKKRQRTTVIKKYFSGYRYPRYRWSTGNSREPYLCTTIRTTQIWQCNTGTAGSYGLAVLTEMSNSTTPQGNGFNWARACSWGIKFSLQNVIAVNGAGLAVTSTNAQYSEFVNLFKYYRLKKVKLTMAPLNPPSIAGTPYPIVYMAFDANDANSGFASEQEMMNFSGLREFTFGPPSSPSGGKQFLTVYPRVMESVQVSTGDNNTMPASKPVWCSTNNPNIQHYGLKLGYYNPNQNSAGAIEATYCGSIHVTYEMEFEFKGIA